MMVAGLPMFSLLYGPLESTEPRNDLHWAEGRTHWWSLPSMHKTLGSISSTGKERKGRKEGREEGKRER
jgi:hypothetical protein